MCLIRVYPLIGICSSKKCSIVNKENLDHGSFLLTFFVGTISVKKFSFYFFKCPAMKVKIYLDKKS